MNSSKCTCSLARIPSYDYFFFFLFYVTKIFLLLFLTAYVPFPVYMPYGYEQVPYYGAPPYYDPHFYQYSMMGMMPPNGDGEYSQNYPNIMSQDNLDQSDINFVEDEQEQHDLQKEEQQDEIHVCSIFDFPCSIYLHLSNL